LLETFADGELDPSDIIEVETHLDECENCAVQLAFVQSIGASVRHVVHADAVVSDDFRSRLESALLAEEQRESETNERAVVAQSRARWLGVFEKRSSSSLLAAAAMMVAWFGWQHFGGAGAGNQADHGSAALPGGQEVASAGMGMEDALDRLIDLHSAQQAPQVTEVNLLPTLEPDVGVRIHVPALIGAHWEGASLVPVVNHQAASLRYSMPGHRVTVYVFDPRHVPVHQPLHRLQQRVSGDEPVYVGQWRGYAVAAKERRGVGYAMTADLDDQEILQMISSIQ
jgi:anti-sigma factor RsiW